MPEKPTPQEEIRVLREDPSPLVMKKTRTLKEDGRYLIYYEFSRPGRSTGAGSDPSGEPDREA